MIKKILALLLLPLLAFATVSLFLPSKAHAAFVANDLMSDGIFENQSMNASQIDAFLNSYANSCISTNNGFTAAEPIGYTPSAGYKYGDYVSAGTIIYDAAHAYGINPRVLITTMQKEEGLVRGDGPYGCGALSISATMGYNCPDNQQSYDWTPNPSLYAINGNPVRSVSGTCVNDVDTVGFSPQVIVAAWKLRWNEQRSEGNVGWDVQLSNFPHAGNVWDNSDDPPTCYNGPMTQGNFKRCSSDPSTTPFNGYTTIDGQSVHMDTGATASFYYYTPHFSGNQSFYNLWTSSFNFGPVAGNDYDWSVSDVSIAQNGTPLPNSNVQGNQHYVVTITATNTGNQAWSATNHPVDIGTFAPTDHNSALFDSSWPAYNRPATMSGTFPIQPGQSGTLTFAINVPNRSGTYDEQFNLVAEGASWFAGSGYDLHLIITKSIYSWSLNQQTSDASTGFTLLPGQIANFTLKANNTSPNVTWTNTGNPVRLATWLPTNHNSPFCSDNTNWVSGCIRAATLQDASVGPGGVGTFKFTVQAPQAQGFYAEHFNLVMEGVSWFDDPGVEFDVNVTRDTRWHMVSQSSTNGWNLAKGGFSQVTLVAHNDGNMTWNNTTNPVRLATWNPAYRNSPFCSDNTNWINYPPYGGCVRAANMVGPGGASTVAPGQDGTFTFTVQAPQKTGFYAERFNLVAEGLTWFSDPWLEFDFTVH